MVVVKLLNYIILETPGTVVRAWGFDFTVQPDRTATMELPIEAAEREQAAGRVAIIGTVEPKSKPAGDKAGSDPSDFFGYGSREALLERMKSLNKTALDMFSRKIGIDSPNTLGKDVLINLIMAKADAGQKEG